MPVSATSGDFGKPTNKLGILTNLTHSDSEASKKCMSLFDDAEGFLRQIQVPKVSDLTFIVEGIPFHTRNTPRGDVADLVIWGTLGYLPYSVVSAEKRRCLIAILEGSRCLHRVRFGVDTEMRIVVTAQFEIPNPPSPNYIFEPLIRFLEEANPFIKLVGEYL